MRLHFSEVQKTTDFFRRLPAGAKLFIKKGLRLLNPFKNNENRNISTTKSLILHGEFDIRAR